MCKREKKMHIVHVKQSKEKRLSTQPAPAVFASGSANQYVFHEGKERGQVGLQGSIETKKKRNYAFRKSQQKN